MPQAVRELFWAAIGLSGYQDANVAVMLIVTCAVLAIWLYGCQWLERQLKKKYGPQKWTEKWPRIIATILTTILLTIPIIPNPFVVHSEKDQSTAGQSKVDETPAGTVSCDCDPTSANIVMPTEGVVNWIGITEVRAQYGGGGLDKVFGPVGKETKLPSPVEMYRCRVVNHGNGPIFSFNMSLRVTFKEAISEDTTPRSYRTGEITSVHEWPIPIPEIGGGPSGMFIFYISARSSKFTFVSLPEFVTFERANVAIKDTVRLRHPPTLELLFPPMS